MNSMASTQGTCSSDVLYMAFDLGSTKWVLLSSCPSSGKKARRRRFDARDLLGVLEEIEAAKASFGLRPDSRVRSVYEAGRDGFWIDRWLRRHGVENIVVDAASIETNRRARRVKTDRIDAESLLRKLVRFYQSAEDSWSIVRVPTPEQEDLRRISREIERLTREASQHKTRVKSLLALSGRVLASTKRARVDFAALQSPTGEALRPHVKRELEREWERLTLIRQQLKEIATEQKELLKSAPREVSDKVRMLSMLKGIGPRSSWSLVLEFFAWREFKNRRQVGALAGIVGTPYESDVSSREQGISKAGNPRVRSLMVEIAWGWLRYQPQSKLSHWFRRRFGWGSKRVRRVGIVALARKLLIALWHYLDHGVVPEGAFITE